MSRKLGINALEIYNRQLRGMVFFLTGNCHLEWE
ncbi:ABC-three component system protein [Escherichia coli]